MAAQYNTLKVALEGSKASLKELALLRPYSAKQVWKELYSPLKTDLANLEKEFNGLGDLGVNISTIKRDFNAASSVAKGEMAVGDFGQHKSWYRTAERVLKEAKKEIDAMPEGTTKEKAKSNT